MTVPSIAPDQTFGHWRVLSIAHRRALCRCRCGQVHEVAIEVLEDGTSSSCGCAAPSRPANRAINEARQERQRLRNFNWKLERGR